MGEQLELSASEALVLFVEPFGVEVLILVEDAVLFGICTSEGRCCCLRAAASLSRRRLGLFGAVRVIFFEYLEDIL